MYFPDFDNSDMKKLFFHYVKIFSVSYHTLSKTLNNSILSMTRSRTTCPFDANNKKYIKNKVRNPVYIIQLRYNNNNNDNRFSLFQNYTVHNLITSSTSMRFCTSTSAL